MESTQESYKKIRSCRKPENSISFPCFLLSLQSHPIQMGHPQFPLMLEVHYMCYFGEFCSCPHGHTGLVCCSPWQLMFRLLCSAFSLNMFSQPLPASAFSTLPAVLTAISASQVNSPVSVGVCVCSLLGYSVVWPFKATGRCSELLVLRGPEAPEDWSRRPLPLAAAQGLQLPTEQDKDQHR